MKQYNTTNLNFKIYDILSNYTQHNILSYDLKFSVKLFPNKEFYFDDVNNQSHEFIKNDAITNSYITC